MCLYFCSIVWVASNEGIVPDPTKSSAQAKDEKMVTAY